MSSAPSELSRQIVDKGVAVWRQFLSPKRSEELRLMAESLLAGPHASQYPRSTRVWELYRHGDAFVDVVFDSRLVRLAEQVLGPHPVVSDFSLNQVRKGGQPDRWHIDYPFNEMPVVVSGATLGLQCILALSPFSKETGSTQFQPGSHVRFEFPPEDATDDDADEFIAQPGDLLAMAAATWHRAGVNSMSEPRTAILVSYVESWVRPMAGPPEPGPWGRDDRARILLGMQRPPEVMTLDGDIPI